MFGSLFLWINGQRNTDNMTREKTHYILHDFTSILSFTICQILISLIVSLCSLPSNWNLSFSLGASLPSAASGSVTLPHFLVSSVPLLSIYLPPCFLLLLPLFLLLLLPLRSRLSLSFPLAHTLGQHPLHFYLHTHLLPHPSPLCSCRLLPSPSPTNTHHLSQPPPVSCLPPPSPPFLPSFSRTQPCCLAQTRAHTHADWHPRTEHPLRCAGDQAVSLAGPGF